MREAILRYLRVVIGDCSVPKDEGACWNTFRKQPGLKAAPMPKCIDYKGADAGVSPSVIAYPVEVLLFPKPTIKALAILWGALASRLRPGAGQSLQSLASGANHRGLFVNEVVNSRSCGSGSPANRNPMS